MNSTWVSLQRVGVPREILVRVLRLTSAQPPINLHATKPLYSQRQNAHHGTVGAQR